MDWMGESQSRSKFVSASNSPASGPVTRFDRASVSARVAVVNSVRSANRVPVHSSVSGSASRPVTCGIVTGRSWSVVSSAPSRRRRTACRTYSSVTDGTWPWAAASDSSSRFQRPRITSSSRRCRSVLQAGQYVRSGPRSRALRRRGDPGPSAIGSIPSARSTGVYSPFRSPEINVLKPNGIIRRQNAHTVDDFPRRACRRSSCSGW